MDFVVVIRFRFKAHTMIVDIIKNCSFLKYRKEFFTKQAKTHLTKTFSFFIYLYYCTSVLTNCVPARRKYIRKSYKTATPLKCRPSRRLLLLLILLRLLLYIFRTEIRNSPSKFVVT